MSSPNHPVSFMAKQGLEPSFLWSNSKLATASLSYTYIVRDILAWIAYLRKQVGRLRLEQSTVKFLHGILQSKQIRVRVRLESVFLTGEM